MRAHAYALCLFLILCVTSAQAQMTPADQQFTFAVRLMREGQTDLARDAFKDFVRDYPSDRRSADASYQLALIARDAGDAKNALAYLERVNRPLHVSDVSVKLLRGQLLLEQNQPEEALGVLEKVDAKSLSDDGMSSTWHYLSALALKRTGKLDSAGDRFTKAAEADTPLRPRALIELSKVQLSLEQKDAAMISVKQAVQIAKQAGDASEAVMLEAHLAYQAKQYEAAIAGYDRIIESYATSDWFKPAVAGLLRSLYAAGNTQQFIKRHDQLAARIAPADLGQVLYLRAATHARLKEYDKAIAWLKQYTQRTGPNHPQSSNAVYLAGICLFHTDTEAFEDWYAKTQPDSRELLYLRALAAIERKQTAQAVEYLSTLIDKPGQYARRALLQRAALREQMDQPKLAAEDYAKFAADHGKDERAKVYQRRAIELAFQSNAYDRVIELGGQWLKANPKDEAEPNVRLVYALAMLKQNKAADSIVQLDRVIAAKPDAAVLNFAHFYRGMALASQFSAENREVAPPAIASLNQALKGKLPEAQQAEGWSVIAQLYRQTDKPAQALGAYQSLRALKPSGKFDPRTALWVGKGLLDSNKPREALAWLESVAEQQANGPELRSAAMFYYAGAQAALKQHAKAIETYRRLLAFSQTFGDQGRLGLARSLRASGDRDGAIEEYDGLINVRGSAVAASALYESAILLLEQSQARIAAGQAQRGQADRTEARRRLNRVVILYDLKELDPLPLQAMLALGRLDVVDGRNDLAVERFNKVLDRPNQPAWHELAKAEQLLVGGRTNQARAALQAVVQKYANSIAADHASARLAEIGIQP